MPSLHIVAIKASRYVVVDGERQMRQVEALLGQAGFVGAMISRMAKYPPQVPPTGQRQSLGRAMGALKPKRAYINLGYVRTGTLGRNWRPGTIGRVGDDFVAEAVNDTDYAVYVQGPPDGAVGERQTDVMADRGWQNIVDEANAEWPNWRPRVLRVFSTR